MREGLWDIGFWKRGFRGLVIGVCLLLLGVSRRHLSPWIRKKCTKPENQNERYSLKDVVNLVSIRLRIDQRKRQVRSKRLVLVKKPVQNYS